jgi:hypothetical protein
MIFLLSRISSPISFFYGIPRTMTRVGWTPAERLGTPEMAVQLQKRE